jgi:hypothetical protein
VELASDKIGYLAEKIFEANYIRCGLVPSDYFVQRVQEKKPTAEGIIKQKRTRT